MRSVALELALPLAMGLLCVASCRPAGGPEWIDLSRDRRELLDAARLERSLGSEGVRVVARDGAAFLEHPIRRQDWTRGPVPGLWSAVLGIRGPGRVPDGHPRARLSAGERTFQAASARDRKGEPGTFRHVARRIWISLEPDDEPPEATLSVAATPGFVDAGGVLRVKGRRFSGSGLPLWSGGRVEIRLDVPAGSALRTVTCAERALLDGRAPVVRFRIELDGTPLLDHDQEVPPRGSFAVHELLLPARARRGARLVLTVEGDFAYTSFLAPMVGPAEVGRYGERPWDGERPSVVVFLADTFRADNLGVGLTPFLDAFSLEGLAFPRAWSVSTFTLPAHASMFAGVFPHQAAIEAIEHALPEEVETVAELLRASGYRTGAITDSGLVSQRLGMDQGFELFDEARIGLGSTLERVRAFLDADDGRPVFLWVQSYETHKEYEVSAATLREHGERLGIDGSETHVATERRLRRLLASGAAAGTPELEDALAKLRGLYLGTVADLDRGFGGFLADLRARGLDRAGFVVFTSDHGEAFLEHGELYHRGRVYEEQLRVPLAIQGPGIVPAVAGHPASLLDLPPTFAAMAGLEARPHWLGTSLLAPGRDRPIFAAQCTGSRGETTYALIDGGRKVISYEDPEALRAGRVFAAYDLDRDPGEREDLAGSAEWVHSILEGLGPQAADLLEPLVEADAVELDGESLEELRAMGYAGS